VNIPARPTADENHLARQAQPIIKRVARRVHRELRRRLDVSDLESIGNEALVRLVRQYDPAVAPFGPYLARHLRWAMLDQVRRRRHGYPAAMLARALGAVDRIRDTTEPKRLQAHPLHEDDARARLHTMLSNRATAMALPIIASHGVASEQPTRLESSGTPESRAMRRAAAARLRTAVAGIEDTRARTLIERHYFRDEAFDVIARDLGLSKWQACRLHKRTLQTLSKRLRGTELESAGVS